MHQYRILVITVCLLLLAGTAFAVPEVGSLWVCEAQDGNQLLTELDPFTGTVLGTVPIVIDSLAIGDCYGLAFKPATDQLFALISFSTSSRQRILVVMDAETGLGTEVGPAGGGTGDYHVGLAFSLDGSTLYTNGGSACDVGCNTFVHEIDQFTGLTTPLVDADAGESKKSIAVGGDGNIYFASNEIVRINPNTLSVVEINADDDDDVDDAMAWDPTRNFFIGIDRNELVTMDLAGNITALGTSDGPMFFQPRGMAVFGEQSVLTIPTVSTTGAAIMMLLVSIAAFLRMRRA